jgi:hypothetical protein
VGRAREEVVSARRREASDNPHKLPRQVREVGLAKHALVPAARLRDLGKGATVGLGVLRAYLAREVCLLTGNNAGGAKDAPGLLKLRRVRELLLAVLPDKDLNPIPVATAPERRQRLASDVPAPEEELRKGALHTEEGVLVPERAHKLLPRRLI